MKITLFDLLANQVLTHPEIVEAMKALGKEFIDEEPISYAALAAALGYNIPNLLRVLYRQQDVEIGWLRGYIMKRAVRVRYLIVEPCVLQMLDAIVEYHQTNRCDLPHEVFDEYLVRLRRKGAVANKEHVAPSLRFRVSLDVALADVVRHFANAAFEETIEDLILIADRASQASCVAVQLAQGDESAARERKRQAEELMEVAS